jgi:hypothetical protein
MPENQLPRGVCAVESGFWNIRGSFKVGGVIDIGTQMSVVRRADGKFVLLDACALEPDAQAWLDALTHGGDDVAAVLHLHPFHTLHVRGLHAAFPKAQLYGTGRHLNRMPELPWQELCTETPELHRLFADDLDFSVPRGVDFVPADENLHFSSVLAFHRASKTLHVDDTLLYFRMPPVVRLVKRDVTWLHPTLPKVLQRRPGAVAEFRDWAGELVERSHSVRNLCAAHAAVLLGRKNKGASVTERIEGALRKVEPKLVAHARQHD